MIPAPITLTFGVISLLIACLFTFVLFRHIEIRKVEAHNESATPENPPRSHTKRDDIMICLRVLAVLVVLLIFMNESQGWRWISIIASYLFIIAISTAILVRGSAMPSLIKERKWEYLALFSILIFWAGAAISTICYAMLKIKLGGSSVVPASIVGYEEYEYDDDVSQKGCFIYFWCKRWLTNL